MNPINDNINDFLNENQVSSVCFIDKENKPHCINCFYAWHNEDAILIFKSSFGTNHDSLIKQGEQIAGTVVNDQINLSKIKGIQFNGELIDQNQINELGIANQYLKKFPLSIAMPGYLWGVKLNLIKFTDNTFVFGNKTNWSRN